MLSPVEIRIFCPITTKFCPNIAFSVILGQALLVHLVPCWWVGWWLWRAGCISQDTYLLYKILVRCCVFVESSKKNHLGLELLMSGINVKFKLVQAGELSVALWTRKDVFTAAVFLLYQRDGFQNLPLFLVQCKQFLVS